MCPGFPTRASTRAGARPCSGWERTDCGEASRSSVGSMNTTGSREDRPRVSEPGLRARAVTSRHVHSPVHLLRGLYGTFIRLCTRSVSQRHLQRMTRSGTIATCMTT